MQQEQLNQESLIELILVMGVKLAAQQVSAPELREQLAKNSHNWGRPPVSDGLKKRRKQSMRQSVQRPRRGNLATKIEPFHM